MTILRHVWAYYQVLRFQRGLLFSERQAFYAALCPRVKWPTTLGGCVAYPDAAFMMEPSDVNRAKKAVEKYKGDRRIAGALRDAHLASVEIKEYLEEDATS